MVIRRHPTSPSYAQGLAQHGGVSEWPGIWNNLVYLVFAGDALRIPRDIAGRQFLASTTSTVAHTISTLGHAWDTFGGTDTGGVLTVPQPDSLDSSSAWTALVVCSFTTTPSSRGALGIGNALGGGRFCIKPAGSNTSNRFGVWWDQHIFDVDVGALNDGLMRSFLFVSRSATDHEIFLDGISQGTNTDSHLLNSNTTIHLGHDHFTQPFHGIIRMAAVWDRPLSDADIYRVGRDPESIVRLRRRAVGLVREDGMPQYELPLMLDRRVRMLAF